MRLSIVISLLLLAVAGLFAPAGPAYAHVGHADAAAAARAAAPSRVTVAVLQSGSHCPGDTGGCCCGADRCAGSKTPRWLATAIDPTPASAAPVLALPMCGPRVLAVAERGAPATTRLARAPPYLV